MKITAKENVPGQRKFIHYFAQLHRQTQNNNEIKRELITMSMQFFFLFTKKKQPLHYSVCAFVWNFYNFFFYSTIIGFICIQSHLKY